MLDQLSKIEYRYLELERELSDPSVMTDIERYKKLTKERASIEEIVTEYRSYRSLSTSISDCKEMLSENNDPEMTPLIRTEISELEEKLEASGLRLKELLIPKDPNDDKNVIIEIRAGTGGDEAALFAGDLYRMYARYAERKGYTFEVVSENTTDMGGVKEAIVSVGGKTGTYSRLKFESGVHRVQRVPVTESQGRIQTSAATVAVLPEVDDLDIEIKESDLRIDTYRSSGAGGQHVNKTSSAIRITHIPTGIVVQCQNERSQFQNKDQAMRVLKSCLYDHYESIRNKEIVDKRKTMVGSGDRSERIRTYNFPQNRLTDHRINKTMYKLELYMDGDLDEMIDAMILAERAEKLSGEGS